MTTSYVPSVIVYSAVEFRIEQAFDAGLAHKQTSRQRRLAQLVGAQSIAGAGDEQLVHAGPAEADRGRPRHRHFQHPVDLAVLRITGDAPAVPVAAPEIAFGIDRHAVRVSRIGAAAEEALALADQPGVEVDIVAIDLLGEAVGEIGGASVRGEGGAIRADDGAVDAAS